MNLVTRWGALPNTRIDDLLAEGCKQCDRLGVAHTLARLVRWRVGADAAGVPIDQVRLVCCHCHVRLGTALKMTDHPNWREYPEYDAAYAKLTDAVASVAWGDVDAARKLCRKSPSLLLEEIDEILQGGLAPIAFRPRRMSVEEIVQAIASDDAEPVLKGVREAAAAGQLFVCDGVSKASLLAGSDAALVAFAKVGLSFGLPYARAYFIIRIDGEDGAQIIGASERGVEIAATQLIPHRLGELVAWGRPAICDSLLILGLVGLVSAHSDRFVSEKRARIIVRAIPPQATDAFYAAKPAVIDRTQPPRPRKIPRGTHRSPRPHDRRAHERRRPGGSYIIVAAAAVNGGSEAADQVRPYTIIKANGERQ